MSRKIKHSIVLLFAISFMLALTGCGKEPNAATPAGADKTGGTVELTVSAAASMTDALKEIQEQYETKNTDIKLHFNFGASGAIQQQIEQGAPADLFLSAATKNMDALIDQRLIDSDRHTTILTNELVAVVPAEGQTAIKDVADLSGDDVKNVAIGIPESVPAGGYAKEALTHLKLWDSLQSKMVQGKDVRQVLQYVETGNADVGFVYKTDALTSKRVEVAFTVDPQTYTSVEYPFGIVAATKHGEEAEAFFNYLQSQEALDVFIKYGFSLLK